MKKRTLALGIGLLISAALASIAAPPDPVATRFVGTWRLVSTTQRLADGSQRANPKFGPNGQGYLMYTGTHMCAVLVRPDRPQWGSEQTPSEQEVRSAIDGLVAYCGAYEVDSKQGLVIHHVEVDRVPNAVGTLRKRHFMFSGNRLILRLPDPLPEGVVESSLTWERIEK